MTLRLVPDEHDKTTTDIPARDLRAGMFVVSDFDFEVESAEPLTDVHGEWIRVCYVGQTGTHDYRPNKTIRVRTIDHEF